jgi:hypothetical protein
MLQSYEGEVMDVIGCIMVGRSIIDGMRQSGPGNRCGGRCDSAPQAFSPESN